MDRAEAALALSAVALVPAIYAGSLPPAAALAGIPDDGGHQLHALTTATATAAAVVVAVAVVTRTPAVLALGLVAIGAQWHIYSRAVTTP